MLIRLINNNLILYFLAQIFFLSNQPLFAQIQNKIDIEFSSNTSKNWWDVHSNKGFPQSKINIENTTQYKFNGIEFNLSLKGNDKKILLSETFIKLNFSSTSFLRAGKYYRDFSHYLNDSISSGSMLISKNAQPMPKIGYLINYPIKRNDLYIKFGISHAIFEKNNTYKTAPFLHEKYLYLNKQKGNLEWGVGIVHEAIWGGETQNYGRFPVSFNDFFKIFISADGPKIDGINHTNALGNHLGIWDFYYKKNIDEKVLKFYYQHFFEDTSGLRFANKFDGLWGIELENYIKNTSLLFEYLSTINQDANSNYLIDSYYNHTEYIEGWSYKNFVIGNPFIDNIIQNPAEIIHIGISSLHSGNYFYRALISRKIGVNDDFKYRITFGSRINNIILGFVVSHDIQKEYGIKLYYNLK